MSAACPSCGAANPGTFVCHYCGGALRRLDDEDEQRKALDELHAQLATVSEATIRSAILVNGFLPAHPRVLVDAGLRMLPVLEDQVSEGAAAGRLRAIILKLELMASDDAATAAAKKLAAGLARYERHDRFVGRAVGIGLLVIVVGGIALAIAWAA